MPAAFLRFLFYGGIGFILHRFDPNQIVLQPKWQKQIEDGEKRNQKTNHSFPKRLVRKQNSENCH